MACTVALVSFRLGGPDGVAVVAAQWQRLLEDLGCTTRTVAAEGPVDVVVPGLAIDGTERGVPPPGPAALAAALDGVDLAIVENLCSLPLNVAAAEAVAGALAGRPAVLHHHDLPWQRPRFAGVGGFPPTDPAWVHVVINELTRAELAARGVDAVVIPNAFDVDEPAGGRVATRAALGLGPADRLALHPVRAIERKDVPTALAVAERLGAAYWLLGPAEEGYGPELARVLGRARTRVLRGLHGHSVADAYAAADVVLFPSVWEGFGNPTVESAVHRRPLALRRYPVAREIEAHGFRWFDVDDAGSLAALDRFLDAPDPALLDHNLSVARANYSLDALRARLVALLDRAVPGWPRAPA